MKERGRSFEEIYRDLVQISEEGADIYGSQLVQEILGAGCQISAAGLSASLLRMQLEQEWFLRQGEDGVFWSFLGWDAASDLMDKLHRSVCECLGRRLERYQREARRGALLTLLDRLEGMGEGQLLPEGERAVSARLPEGELIALAAECVERHAGELWEGYEEDGTESREQSGEQGELSVTIALSGVAAALAVAAYADCPELRRNPELLADISAAAAGLAHVPRQETVKATAYMALLMAAVSLAEPSEMLFSPEIGVADSREKAVAFFEPYRQLFAAELRLMLGAGAAELLAVAAAAARSFEPSRHKMKDMDQAMDSVAEGETEQSLMREQDSREQNSEEENPEKQNSEEENPGEHNFEDYNSEEENPEEHNSEEWSPEDLTEAE